MISKLDIDSFKERSDMVKLQKASYLIEASLINYDKIPGLLDDEEKIRNSGETFYGYKMDGILVGLISYKMSGTVLDIHRLAVHEAYFNRGIATALIKALETLGENVSGIIVSTGRENHPACQLYQKLGFIKTGESTVAEGLIIAHFEKSVE